MQTGVVSNFLEIHRKELIKPFLIRLIPTAIRNQNNLVFVLSGIAAKFSLDGSTPYYFEIVCGRTHH